MTELLLMAHDHAADPATTVKQRAALHSPFDLIVAKPDGWAWGEGELTHAWFRIIRWPAMTDAEAEALAGSMPPARDSSGNATTLWQRCAARLDLADARLPPAFRRWWADDTRAVPIFVVPANFPAPAALHKVRPAVADPDYLGTGAGGIGRGISG